MSADSTPHRSRGKESRPRKPRKDFPLSIHWGTGDWCKQVYGKVHYLGKVADDPKGVAALEEWQHQQEHIRQHGV